MLRTLKAKAIATGVLMVAGTIALLTTALYVQSKRELEDLLAQEEFAAASRLAAEFDSELSERRDALQRIARSVPAGILGDPVRLKQVLAERPALEGWLTTSAKAFGSIETVHTRTAGNRKPDRNAD